MADTRPAHPADPGGERPGSGPAGLLDVQDHDLRIDGLLRRRGALPERTEVATADAALAAGRRRREQRAGERDALRRELRRLEDELSVVEDKERAERERLYSGTVTAAKDLAAIEAELGAIARRRDLLEDRVLTAMDAVAPVDAEVDAMDQRLADTEAARSTAATTLTVSEAEIDAEIDGHRGERDRLAAGLPDDLLARYDQLRRGRGGGVVVGRLEANHHTACSIDLSAVALDRLRRLPAGSTETCEECGGLIVL